MYTVRTHYAAARLLSLFLCFVFGIVSFALGLSASVKSNAQKDEIARLVPDGVSVSIDTADIVGAGTAVAVFSILLALTSLAALALLAFALLPRRTSKSGKNRNLGRARLATRTLPWQSALLSLLTLGLLSSAIAMTDIFATREAQVNATALGFDVPAFIIHAVEEGSGITPVYHEIGYRECVLAFRSSRHRADPCSSRHAVRLAVVFPWIAFLFGATSSALSLAAWRRSRATSQEVHDTDSDPISREIVAADQKTKHET